MKRVNFDPDLELKKARIMEEFNQSENQELPARAGAADQEMVADVPESDLKEQIIDALRTVYDPEIPVNIYDLGLIYDVRIDNGFVEIDMTLTAPGCPVAHTFPGIVERSVCLVPGVAAATVEIVWDPPWTPELISEAARLELGLI